MLARATLLLALQFGLHPAVALHAPVQTGSPGKLTGSGCGAARDAVVRALELVRTDSTAATVGDALELVKTSLDLCHPYGDAWYLRSLLERRLHDTRKADYSLKQAADFGSEAKDEGLDPFTLATPLTPPARKLAARKLAATKPAEKWALVVGISHFSDRAIEPLAFTTQDADSFAAALKDAHIGAFAADHVFELTDSMATAHNIKARLNFIARQAMPEDIVVLYVATHGSPRRMDSVGGVNYLVTYETEMYRAGRFDEDAFYASAFPMVELANDVATRMRALRTLVVLDTCYSGGSGPGIAHAPDAAAGVGPAMLERFGQGTGRLVLTASRAGEVSLESRQQGEGHGNFTFNLLQALKASEGRQPIGALFAGVAARTAEQAEAAGQRQHPVLFRSAGDTDFALNPSGGADR